MSEGVLEFVATEAGTVQDGDVLTSGASNGAGTDENHSVIFCRTLDETEDDFGAVYFEVDDQANGGDSLVSFCSLSRFRLTVTLVQPVSWYPDVKTIRVNLASVTDSEFDQFASGLEEIFRLKSDAFERKPR